MELRLSSKGYIFVSQTDTELLAHLVQDVYFCCAPAEASCAEYHRTSRSRWREQPTLRPAP